MKVGILAITGLLNVLTAFGQDSTTDGSPEGRVFIFPTDEGQQQQPSFDPLVNRLAGKVRVRPPSSQLRSRLRGGGRPNRGYLELLDESGRWKLACDPDSDGSGFGMTQANVACRQMGYDEGTRQEGRGGSEWTNGAGLRELLFEHKRPNFPVRVKCKGDERLLEDCQWQTKENFTVVGGRIRERPLTCTSNNLIRIVCNPPPMSSCVGDAHAFGSKCYHLFNSPSKTFQAAQLDCRSKGGILAEINSAQENNFISETLLYQNSSMTDFWTGGLANIVANKEFHIWFNSSKPVEFFGIHQFVQDHVPSVNPDVTTFGIALSKLSSDVTDEEISNPRLIKENTVAGNYIQWTESSLDSKFGYICETPILDIGCLDGDDVKGVNYNGNASRADSGHTCLDWSGSGLSQLADDQQLMRHNFCRNPRGTPSHLNPDGYEMMPYCFIDPLTVEFCTIPKCAQGRPVRWDQVGNDLEDIQDLCNNLLPPQRKDDPIVAGNCASNPERFQCSAEECIFTKFVCDGTADCENGEDEANCLDYMSLFKKEAGFKIQGQDTFVPNVPNAEDCARQCVHVKDCSCTAFSYHPSKQRCIITNSYETPYVSLLERRAWDFYQIDQQNQDAINIMDSEICRRRLSRETADGWQSSQFEGMRLINTNGPNSIAIVEVSVNGTWGGICDDSFGKREADVVCRQMGFELGARNFHDNLGDPETGLIHLYDVHCAGTEDSISDCNKTIHKQNEFCNGNEKAGVDCIKTSRSCSNDTLWHCASLECIPVNSLCDGKKDCTDGSDESDTQCNREFQIRLQNDRRNSGTEWTPGEIGRLEVLHKGVWGTVCDNGFGQAEADVACRMMGYDISSGDHASLYDGVVDYTAKGGPIWINFGHTGPCQGNEDDLRDCQSAEQWRATEFCEHTEDVVLECRYGPHKRFGGSLEELEGYDEDEFETEVEVGDPVVPAGASDCGHLLQATPRIAHGHDTMEGQHPWQASIRLGTANKNFHHCGATIVSQIHVVTAAHCVDQIDASFLIVRVGDHSLAKVDDDEQNFEVDSVTFHEDYSIGTFLNNDIAIVKIKPSEQSNGIQFSDKVSPICLPPHTFRYSPRSTNLTITGWGKIEGGGRTKKSVSADGEEGSEANDFGGSDILREAFVPLISSSRCRNNKVYSQRRISDGMFCAGTLAGGGSDSCQKDSGGPAIAVIKGKATLLGITSWGEGCGLPNRPGVYTKVGNYVDWIQSNLRKGVGSFIFSL